MIEKNNINGFYLTVEETGLSPQEALQTRYVFNEEILSDWDSPEMDVYDQVYVPIIREELKNGILQKR